MVAEAGEATGGGAEAKPEPKREEARMSDLYDTDTASWCEQQAALLRRLAAGERVNDQVDWENVVEEIEDVGGHERDKVTEALVQAGHSAPRRRLMSPRDDSAPPNETDGVKSDGIAAGHRPAPCSQHQPSGAAQRVSARQTIAWPYAGGIVGYHLLALLALVPWFFTWSGVVLVARRVVCLRHPWHQSRLSSPAHPPWADLPQMAGADLRRPGRVLRPGHASPLGVGPSPASSTFG